MFMSHIPPLIVSREMRWVYGSTTRALSVDRLTTKSPLARWDAVTLLQCECWLVSEIIDLVINRNSCDEINKMTIQLLLALWIEFGEHVQFHNKCILTQIPGAERHWPIRLISTHLLHTVHNILYGRFCYLSLYLIKFAKMIVTWNRLSRSYQNAIRNLLLRYSSVCWSCESSLVKCRRWCPLIDTLHVVMVLG